MNQTLTLTKTEDYYTRLKMQGYSRKEIAAKVFRAVGTVQKTFQNIYERNGITSEIELYNRYCKEVLGIDIKKMLISWAMLFLLAPSIFAIPNNDMLRPVRARTRTSRTRTRSGRRKDSDYYM